MLKLQPEPTYTAAVDIPTPWGNSRIKMVFKYMDTEEYDKYIQNNASRQGMTNEDVITEIATGWHEVDGEFSKENIALLCKKYHQAAAKIISVWMETNTQARLEN